MTLFKELTLAVVCLFALSGLVAANIAVQEQHEAIMELSEDTMILQESMDAIAGRIEALSSDTLETAVDIQELRELGYYTLETVQETRR